MCDLCGIANHYGGSVKGIDITAKAIQKVNAPAAYRNKEYGEEVDWVLFGMLWVKIDNQYSVLNCKNFATKAFIENLNEYHFVYGCITAAVPKGKVIGSSGNILLPYVVLKGTIGTDYSSKAILYMNKWNYAQGKFIVHACGISTLDLTKVPKDMQVVFYNTCESSMNSLVNELKVFNIDGICKCGTSGVRGVPEPIISCETFVEIDDNCKILGRKVATESNLVSIVPILEYDVYDSTGHSTEVHTETGLTIRNGRAFYNRDKFYLNKEFEEGLSGLLKSSADKINKTIDTFSNCKGYDIYNEKKYLVEKIIKHYYRKPVEGFGMTGRTLLNNVLSKALTKGVLTSVYSEEIDEYNSTVSNEAMCYEASIRLRYTTSEAWVSIIQNDKFEAIEFLNAWLNKDFKDKETGVLIIRDGQLLMLFVEEILKLGSDIHSLVKPDNALFTMIQENPYNLVYISASTSILDMDKFAMWVNKFNDASLENSRCVAFVHSMLIDENNTVVDCRTSIPATELYTRIKYGFEVTGAYHKQISMNKGYAVDRNVLTNVKAYLYNAQDKGFSLDSSLVPVKSGIKNAAAV